MCINSGHVLNHFTLLKKKNSNCFLCVAITSDMSEVSWTPPDTKKTCYCCQCTLTVTCSALRMIAVSYMQKVRFSARKYVILAMITSSLFGLTDLLVHMNSTMEKPRLEDRPSNYLTLSVDGFKFVHTMQSAPGVRYGRFSWIWVRLFIMATVSAKWRTSSLKKSAKC